MSPLKNILSEFYNLSTHVILDNSTKIMCIIKVR